MWIFWGFFVAVIVGAYLVDLLTGRKHNFEEQEKSLNQNSAGSDALREVGRIDQNTGPF
ncbi:hypothetical protein [Sporosarcina sp. SAFN-010]|uniref:hypothetical protein n=1 Tax=Sporosarcina sp. SAFN-010 TaxID=3387273 RepID=UPI003F80B1BB